jgi:hypothetical protein
VILRETVLTSPRKFASRTLWETFRLSLGIAFGGLRGVRRRKGTEFWYDGRR